MPDQNININLDRGANAHGWQVAGTIIGIGGVGMLAWAMSNAGMLDLAATGLTVFGFQFVGLMLKAGLLVLPEDDGPDFRETKGALRTAWREFQAFQARSPIWRLALMAVLYTVGFMIVRLLLTQAMGIFQNVWIAGGISALVASVIVAPTLISNLIKGVGSKTGVKVSKDKSDRDVEHVRRDEGVKPSPADEAGFIPEVPEDDSDWRQSA